MLGALVPQPVVMVATPDRGLVYSLMVLQALAALEAILKPAPVMKDLAQFQVTKKGTIECS